MPDANHEDFLMLSGIQHFVFCKRQWALIHIEKQWTENILTFEGRQIHERADDPFLVESSGSTIISRSVPLVSKKLMVYGIADVVEFKQVDSGGVKLENRNGLWAPYPIEYKHGKPKQDDCDIFQLCAQAICLEEMLNTTVSEGAMYYHKTRRRQRITFDAATRKDVAEKYGQMHEMRLKSYTPPAEYSKACENCSFFDICLPKMKNAGGRVARYVRDVFENEGW